MKIFNLFFTLAIIFLVKFVYADSKQLIPLSTMLFNPVNFSLDTEGKTHVDPSLWQAGPNGLYIGRGASLKGYRLSVDSQGIVSAVTPNDLLKPDAGWKDIIWNSLREASGGSSPSLTDSPYVSALTLTTNHAVASLTQCVEGFCLTVTAKGCQKFLSLSQSSGFDDLLSKIQKCNDLRIAYEKMFQDKDVVSEMQTAFNKDVTRITKSPITNRMNKPTVGNMGFKLLPPSDLSSGRILQQLYAESCRSHFNTQTLSGRKNENTSKTAQ